MSKVREYFYASNAAMPANTAMPMHLTSCETEIHIQKYHKENDVIRMYLYSELSKLLGGFVLEIF